LETVNDFSTEKPRDNLTNASFFNEQDQNTSLNSAEIANIWSSFMISSIQSCIIKYLQKTVEDQETLGILNYALETVQKHHHRAMKFFQDDRHPVPQGFTDNDVNLNAPRLFSDLFILCYIEKLAEIRINGYSTALPMTARKDVLDFFNECLASSAELYNKVTRVMLSKGFFIRSPYIETPGKIDFVKKQNYLAGFFGNRRHLNVIEISHIFNSIKVNTFRKALFIGFSQVADSKKVREYMLRGKEISTKHIKIFGSIMIKNDLPISMSWDLGVTDSTIPPFSDKLMMQHIRAMNVVEMAYYGKAFSSSTRNDLAVNFSRLMLEIGKYAEDSLNILIDNGWLEEIPQIIDRDALAKSIHH